MRKHFSTYKNFRFSDLEGLTPAYKSSYISRIERAIYPNQILNEHGNRVDNAESGEICKKKFDNLYYISACTVKYI